MDLSKKGSSIRRFFKIDVIIKRKAYIITSGEIKPDGTEEFGVAKIMHLS